MVSPAPETYPLQILVAASPDARSAATIEFVRGITGIDVAITVVPAESDAAAMAMESPVPVMVLPAFAEDQVSLLPFRRILIPLDGSARAAQALPLATKIATGAGLPVQFVMVIDPSRVIPPAFAYDPDSWTIVTALQETAHWALKQAEEPLMKVGVQVESALLYGPVNACLQSAMEPTDLVIMTTHGSGKSPGRIGRVAVRVLASASGPVIIHRVREQREIVVDGYEACSWVEPLSRRTEVLHPS